MTQEEAIKILRDVHDKALFSVRNALETLIPELRESENERIRKGLIKMISNIDGGHPFENYGIIKKEAIAYLEKQKEQKPAEWSDTNELVFKDICKHLKEEGYNGWIVLLEALRNGEFQPKPAWSEEDERIIDTIISVLGQYIDYKAVSGTGSGSAFATPRYSKEIDWLNSLRPSWKPSDEQMKALKYAAYHMLPGEEYRDVLFSLLKDLTKLM